MSTKSISVRWQVDVYPWKSSYPLGEKDLYKETLPKQAIDRGLLSFQFTRSKRNPYGNCEITTYGVLDNNIFVGGWILINSFNGDNIAKVDASADRGIVRFFGQIHNVRQSYTVNENGGLMQINTISVREWSFILSLPIFYDTYALQNTIGNAYMKLAKMQQDLKPLSQERLIDVAKASVDPFGFSGLVLKLIGAMSSEGSKQIQDSENYKKHAKGMNIADLKLPDIALTLPIIPDTLLNDLGFKLEDKANPFSGGLVSTYFGVNTNNYFVNTDEIFYGVFKDSKEFFKQYEIPDNRPLYSNILTMLTSGQSAWDILQQGCDNQFNEVLSDLIYEKGSDGNVNARPFILVRDKPFAIKKLKESDEFTSEWSNYDDLPRITIPAEYIERLDIAQSINEAPNFIRVSYVSDGPLSPSAIKVMSEISGTFRFLAEMKRFGGKTQYVETPYVNTEQGFLTKWYQDVAKITYHWFALLYRMPSCQMVMRDNNIAFTVGMNVKFAIGKNIFVGHLNEYSVTYSRTSAGKHQTTAVLSLERLVMENSASDLIFIPAPLLHNIYDQTIDVSTWEGTTLDELVVSLKDEEKDRIATEKMNKEYNTQKGTRGRR